VKTVLISKPALNGLVAVFRGTINLTIVTVPENVIVDGVPLDRRVAS
jgi:hypothetical protein